MLSVCFFDGVTWPLCARVGTSARARSASRAISLSRQLLRAFPSTRRGSKCLMAASTNAVYWVATQKKYDAGGWRGGDCVGGGTRSRVAGAGSSRLDS